MKLVYKLLIGSIVLFFVNTAWFILEPTYTYIRNIELPPNLDRDVPAMLKELDPQTGGLFSRKSLRPIDITVGPLDIWKLAESRITPLSCHITLNSGYSWDDQRLMRTTVVHEISHCFGFDHEDDPKSVMYWADNTGIDEQSIKEFLPRLKRRGHLW